MKLPAAFQSQCFWWVGSTPRARICPAAAGSIAADASAGAPAEAAVPYT